MQKTSAFRTVVEVARLLVIALVGSGLSTACDAADVVAGNQITFNRDVAPIIFANCSTCHRPGETAPFSLLTYEDVRGHASQIADVTRRRFMPPWLPEAGHGDFAGARRLSDQQLSMLAAWAKAGALRGVPTDLPAVPKFTNGWQLGPPDLVLESPTYTLAADGSDQFRNFVVPNSVTTPQWVESIELRPTNPRATHNARLGVDRSLAAIRRDADDPLPGYAAMAWEQDPENFLVNWVPGKVAHRGTPGAAWRLDPKSCLVLHAHMQPTGKKEAVQFQIGIHFAKQAPTLQPVTLRFGSRAIDIWPGDRQYVATDEYVVPADLDVSTIYPHAHSLCRTVQVQARLPDGSLKSLLWINDFDEKRTDIYTYAAPVRLPRGTRVRSAFTYDNTSGNIRNRHDPPIRAVYGPGVDQEMGDVYLQVIAVRPSERAALVKSVGR